MTERDVWSAWADVWPARRRERDGVVDEAILAFAARHLAGRVLDAGCGDGAYTSALRARSFDVLGVDVTPELLTIARARHPDLRFEEASLARLPFSDAAFDSTFCLTVLEWAADPVASLRELRRVTAGPLVLGVLGAGNRTRDVHLARFWGGSPMNGLLPWELKLLCEREELGVKDELGVSRSGVETGGRDAMTRAMIWLLACEPSGG
ncbi:methyltransferase family protein [Deinococcus yavapaiensis KR-236]|uniref:Methyltransferase family protein n=1 Tax=Deinococcus yavapaiensis KR-236 TaxID=694435 RepID=A0A318SGD6_9DEIO|nr:methyltransferase family protein [Deinococcus yavapaiensis KR-236]